MMYSGLFANDSEQDPYCSVRWLCRWTWVGKISIVQSGLYCTAVYLERDTWYVVVSLLVLGTHGTVGTVFWNYSTVLWYTWYVIPGSGIYWLVLGTPRYGTTGVRWAASTGTYSTVPWCTWYVIPSGICYWYLGHLYGTVLLVVGPV